MRSVGKSYYNRIFKNGEIITMKRKHTSMDFNPVDYIELSRKTAIHEAGHAAAIYFGNKEKQLPPVFFQIIIGDCSCKPHDNCVTKLEGGRLIHTLPDSIEDAICNFSPLQKQAYRRAFEADIVNLLVGSLAEANYIAQRDNELITPRLVPINALHNYGGSSDLDVINEYLDCFIPDEMQQKKKLAELFQSAFSFVSYWSNWCAITALADYILDADKNIISYEEVAVILKSHFHVVRKRA